MCISAPSPSSRSDTKSLRPSSSPSASPLGTKSSSSVTSLSSVNVDASLLSPMMAHWVETKRAYPDFLVLYRVGDFFETFFEDASRFSSLCDVALTAKDAGKALGARVPMAGIPHYTVDDKCRALLAHAVNIAVVDQVEAASVTAPGALVKRAVTRLVTPGTLIDDELLDTSRPNYLASVSVLSWRTATLRFGVALADVCTGEMRATEAEGVDALVKVLRAAQPAEVLIAAGPDGKAITGRSEKKSSLVSSPGSHAKLLEVVSAIHGAGVTVVTGRPSAEYEADACCRVLCARYAVDNVESLGCRARQGIVCAVASLLTFVHATVEVDGRGSVPFCTPSLFFPEDCLRMDDAALRNLEVVETLRDGSSGKSLRWAIDRSATAMGARRVRSWLLAPLKDVDEIMYRQRIVVYLSRKADLRERLGQQLRGFADLERLVGRVGGERASPRELQRLAHSLVKLPAIASLLSESAVDAAGGSASHDVFARIRQSLNPATDGGGILMTDGPLPAHEHSLPELGAEILNALVEPAPVSLLSSHALSQTGPASGGTLGGFAEAGYVFRKGYCEELDGLLASGKQGTRWMDDFERTEQERTGIPSLRIKKLRNSGYLFRIARSTAERLLDKNTSYFADLGYERALSTKTEMRFKSVALTARERKENSVFSAVVHLETQLFHELLRRVGAVASRLREAAAGVAEIDALLGFACVSSEQGYVAPLIEDASSRVLHIIEGRHPVVEQTLPPNQTYVPNSFCMGVDGTDMSAVDAAALYNISELPFCDEMILCGPNAS